MSKEFTGERVIPGQVDADLWNEHYARYVFAARLARRKRVLDIGCGTGYGSAELARTALTVTALDPSPEALHFGRARFCADTVRFLRAAGEGLPFGPATFDLVVAFEVIEHLKDWRRLIAEARRVLAPGGQFVVSTPNKLYYAESRAESGPNPFHEHEFEFEEFRDALSEHFPHVSLFVQNHAPALVFEAIPRGAASETRIDGRGPDPRDSHFFLAVCALAPQIGAPTLVYLPASGNLLREREQHIARLEEELATKNNWLDEARAEHQQLVLLHDAQKQQLEERNRWAQQLNEELQETGGRLLAVQDELLTARVEAKAVVDGYENKIAELERELQARAEWAAEQEREVAARAHELEKAVELLHQAEATVEERTAWAQALDKEVEALRKQLALAQGSRWLRLGRALGLGPSLGSLR
ncbi:MAG: methyltransferase domain-containing protein [Bryobacteraceae bacterium]|nr:methyltransferase domain-containing protein [Bryobacteraceae bacterium]